MNETETIDQVKKHLEGLTPEERMLALMVALATSSSR